MAAADCCCKQHVANPPDHEGPVACGGSWEALQHITPGIPLPLFLRPGSAFRPPRVYAKAARPPVETSERAERSGQKRAENGRGGQKRGHQPPKPAGVGDRQGSNKSVSWDETSKTAARGGAPSRMHRYAGVGFAVFRCGYRVDLRHCPHSICFLARASKSRGFARRGR